MSWLEIHHRVAAWNAARYDREYNKALTLSLLLEEFNETMSAGNKVDELDGRCDQCYVALGGIWKLDLPDSLLSDIAGYSATVVEQALRSGLDDPDEAVALVLAAINNPDLIDSKTQQAMYLFAVIWYNVVAMEWQGLTVADVIEAMNIVCDSNDSKEVKKVASDVKANINKGSSFIAPEPRLQALLDKVAAREIGGADHAQVH